MFKFIFSHTVLALRLDHLGHRLGPPIRERPPNFGAKFDILKKKFRDIEKKINFAFFSTLRSLKELSNTFSFFFFYKRHQCESVKYK